MHRYLCLYFPRWPLQHFLHAQPALREQPVALWERAAHGPRLVVCSPAAEAMGVRSGMPLAGARALAPQVVFEEADHDGSAQHLAGLALWATRFSPLTGVEQTGPHQACPQSLWIDTAGCERVFDGETNLLRLALEGLRKQGLRPRAAYAHTLGAAWALAHYGAASSVAGNDGDLGEILAPLPLAALRLAPATLLALRPLGLRRIGDVLQQPRETLPSRFGPELLTRLDQALGKLHEGMPLLRPAPEFRAAWAFEYPIRGTEMLYRVAERMVRQLAAQLRKAQRNARQIECWLYHEIAAPVCIEFPLQRGSSSAKHLMALLHVRLEDVLNSPQTRLLQSKRPRAAGKRQVFSIDTGEHAMNVEEGVCAAALQITASEPAQDAQLSLFERKPEDELSGGLGLLVNRLAARLGSAAVSRVVLENHPLPEKAWRCGRIDESFVEPVSVAVEAFRPERPLHLFPQPVRVRMSWPEHFEWNAERIAIAHEEGPERIETAWWEERYQRRDYYVATTPNGSRFWLFRCIEDDAWFLHGTFE